MVFLICVYIPDIVLALDAVKNIFYGFKGRHHGVVDIVVAVLPISADAVQIVDRFQIIDQSIHLIVRVKI